MPFLGKDWRSSGEQWIRTEHGWERTRVLECILDNLNIGFVDLRLFVCKESLDKFLYGNSYQKLIKTFKKKLNTKNLIRFLLLLK